MPIFPFFKFFKKKPVNDSFSIVPAQDLSDIYFRESLKKEQEKKQKQQPLFDELRQQVEKNQKFIMSNILMRSKQGKYSYYYQVNKDPFYHKIVALDIEDLKEAGVEDIVWTYLNKLSQPFKEEGYVVNYNSNRKSLSFVWHYNNT